jgi:hypothetical protein
MSLGPSSEQNSSLKKGLGGKPLSTGKGLAGGLGEGADKPAAPAPLASAPAAPIAFEFEDSAVSAEKAKPAAPAPAPSFNPFAEDESAAKPAAPTTNRAEKTGAVKTETTRVNKIETTRVVKTATGRTEKPGTGKTTNPAYDDNNDFAQGTAKDLWTCPHCGAKNKPLRETCRECKKSPDEPVEKAWYAKPLIIGPVVVGVIGLIMLITMVTSVDMSLKPAGVMDNAVRHKSVSENIIDLGESRKLFVRKTATVSGRVIMAGQYPMAPWITAVALALGDKAKDDETFNTWSASFSDKGMDVNAPKSVVLYLIFQGSAEAIKAGDYISVSGKAGVPEQDATIVRGTDEKGVFAMKVEQIQKQ